MNEPITARECLRRAVGTLAELADDPAEMITINSRNMAQDIADEFSNHFGIPKVDVLIFDAERRRPGSKKDRTVHVMGTYVKSSRVRDLYRRWTVDPQHPKDEVDLKEKFRRAKYWRGAVNLFGDGHDLQTLLHELSHHLQLMVYETLATRCERESRGVVIWKLSGLAHGPEFTKAKRKTVAWAEDFFGIKGIKL